MLDVRKSWRLFDELCKERSNRSLAKLVELAKCLLIGVRVGFIEMVKLNGLRFFVVARLYVEFDLVNQRPERPDRLTKSYEERLKKFRAWPKTRRQAIRSHLPMREEDTRHSVELNNNFHLVRNADRIDRYFQVLKQLKHTDKPKQFLMTVKVEQGYVAPLHLIAGLMSRFDLDWAPVMKDFSREKIDAKTQLIDIGSGNVSLYALRNYQMFIFDCWLLWGPSIPICSCDQWQGHKALQLGYGDENNSLSLLKMGSVDPMFATFLNGVLTSPIPKYCSVTVRPCSSLADEVSLCECQLDVIDPDMGSASVLDYVSHTEHTSTFAESGYYSAYLWSMFIICRAGKNEGLPEPIDFSPNEDKTRPGLSMLPFFEHGNIADEDIYRSMKQQLAHKILYAIERLIKDCDAAGQHLVFCYACAIDDPGCDTNNQRTFGSQNNVKGIGQTLRETMEQMLQETQFTAIRNQVLFSDTWRKTYHARYSACRMPTIVKQYYTHLDALKN